MNTMSSFTRCRTNTRFPNPLTMGRSVKILLIGLIVMGFFLAHLHLRFTMNRMNSETMRLQKLQGTLQSELNELRNETARLKNPQRLLEFARNDLGMVDSNPSEHQTLALSEEIYTRYAMARSAHSETENFGPEAERGAVWLEAMGERIGLVGPAMASESGKGHDSK
jgi:cell division protein FtsL